jgi:hypothetical protein
MSNAIASTTKKIRRASAEGPCLKRGGGLYSMVGAEGVNGWIDAAGFFADGEACPTQFRQRPGQMPGRAPAALCGCV